MTAEVAVTFPVVVLALAVVLLAGSVAQAGVACADAARSAGRAVARGDTAAVVETTARQVAGRPVRLEVSGAGTAGGDPGPEPGGLVDVAVTVEAGAVLVPAWVDPATWRLPVSCRARAWREPSG